MTHYWYFFVACSHNHIAAPGGKVLFSCFYFSDCSCPTSFASSSFSIYSWKAGVPQGPSLTSVPLAGLLFYCCRLDREPHGHLNFPLGHLSWVSDCTSMGMDASQVPQSEHVSAHLLQLSSLFPRIPRPAILTQSMTLLFTTCPAKNQAAPVMAPFLLPKGVHQAPCPHSLVWFSRALVNLSISFLSSHISPPSPPSPPLFLSREQLCAAFWFSHSSMPVHSHFPLYAFYTFYLYTHPPRCNSNVTSLVHTDSIDSAPGEQRGSHIRFSLTQFKSLKYF